MAGRRNASVLAGYSAISFLYFGVRLLPHPGRSYVGEGADPEIFIWSLAWWPHAILHGENPVVTHAIWAPDGVNLAWATAIPGLALALAPLTLAAGPVVAYNVVAILMPALAAWTGFLLCHRVVGRLWPALVAGYLFGFSTYMLGQQFGHVHMTSVFLLPLVALLVLRRLDGEIGGRRFAVLLGVLLAAQISLSTEVALTLTVALVVGLALAWVAAPRRRAHLRALAAPLAGAYGVGALLASPLLVYALRDFEHESINPPALYTADLLNFVLPTGIVAASGSWATTLASHFPGNSSERGAYIGIPTLLIIALHAIRSHRTAATRFLLAALGAASLAALGGTLVVAGHRTVPLPWTLVDGLPGLNNVLPVRLSVFVLLAAAVLVARWLADERTPPWLRLALAALAVVSVVPHPHVSWRTKPHSPTFFADRGYERALAPTDNVIAIPYGANGDSMLWQAESGFAFRMAGGYIRPNPPPSFARLRTVKALNDEVPPPGGAAAVRAFARAKGVTAIVVARDGDRWRPLFAPFGPPQALGNVLLYRLRRPPSTR
jgi:hypothetical protein